PRRAVRRRDERGIGREGEVDDRVVGEGVEEGSVLRRAPLGRAGGEVPIAAGSARARADGRLTLALDLVLDDGTTAEDLDDHTRTDDPRLVRLFDRLDDARDGHAHLHARLHVDAPGLPVVLGAPHHGHHGTSVVPTPIAHDPALPPPSTPTPPPPPPLP